MDKIVAFCTRLSYIRAIWDIVLNYVQILHAFYAPSLVVPVAVLFDCSMRTDFGALLVEDGRQLQPSGANV